MGAARRSTTSRRASRRVESVIGSPFGGYGHDEYRDALRKGARGILSSEAAVELLVVEGPAREERPFELVRRDGLPCCHGRCARPFSEEAAVGDVGLGVPVV